MSEEKVKIGATYKHYKGKLYKVHSLAIHSETLEKLVYYECLYENDLGNMWVRPLDNFASRIHLNGEETHRFKLVSI